MCTLSCGNILFLHAWTFPNVINPQSCCLASLPLCSCSAFLACTKSTQNQMTCKSFDWSIQQNALKPTHVRKQSCVCLKARTHARTHTLTHTHTHAHTDPEYWINLQQGPNFSPGNTQCSFGTSRAHPRHRSWDRLDPTQQPWPGLCTGTKFWLEVTGNWQNWVTVTRYFPVKLSWTASNTERICFSTAFPCMCVLKRHLSHWSTPEAWTALFENKRPGSKAIEHSPLDWQDYSYAPEDFRLFRPRVTF